MDRGPGDEGDEGREAAAEFPDLRISESDGDRLRGRRAGRRGGDQDRRQVGAARRRVAEGQQRDRDVRRRLEGGRPRPVGREGHGGAQEFALADPREPAEGSPIPGVRRISAAAPRFLEDCRAGAGDVREAVRRRRDRRHLRVAASATRRRLREDARPRRDEGDGRPHARRLRDVRQLRLGSLRARQRLLPGRLPRSGGRSKRRFASCRPGDGAPLRAPALRRPGREQGAVDVGPRSARGADADGPRRPRGRRSSRSAISIRRCRCWPRSIAARDAS